jgi:hypothetical protein
MYDYDNDKKFHKEWLAFMKERNLTEKDINRFKVVYHSRILRELGRNPWGLPVNNNVAEL